MFVLKDVTLAKAIDVMLSKKAAEAEITGEADKLRYVVSRAGKRTWTYNGRETDSVLLTAFNHDYRWDLTIHKTKDDL
jgi:hypothetical protein